MKEKIRTYIQSRTPKQKKMWIAGLIALFILLVLISKMAAPKVYSDAYIINQVSALTTVPNPNEDMPALFTIKDPAHMPAFFKGAQAGDITLLYLKSQLAVIYSPSRNIIVNKGPIVNDAPVQQATKEQPTVKTEQRITASSTTN